MQSLLPNPRARASKTPQVTGVDSQAGRYHSGSDDDESIPHRKAGSYSRKKVAKSMRPSKALLKTRKIENDYVVVAAE